MISVHEDSIAIGVAITWVLGVVVGWIGGYRYARENRPNQG